MKKTNTEKSPLIATVRHVPTHHDISILAERIWHKRGCPQGQDEAIWLEAERRLNSVPASSGMSGAMRDLNDLFPGSSGQETTSL